MTLALQPRRTMELNFKLAEDLRVTPTVKSAVEILRERCGKHDDELTYPQIVESIQLKTLEKVYELLNNRNKVVAMSLERLIEPYPIEIKQNFVNDTMKFSLI